MGDLFGTPPSEYIATRNPEFDAWAERVAIILCGESHDSAAVPCMDHVVLAQRLGRRMLIEAEASHLYADATLDARGDAVASGEVYRGYLRPEEIAALHPQQASEPRAIATVGISLHSADPGPDGSEHEVVASGYQRRQGLLSEGRLDGALDWDGLDGATISFVVLRCLDGHPLMANALTEPFGPAESFHLDADFTPQVDPTEMAEVWVALASHYETYGCRRHPNVVQGAAHIIGGSTMGGG